ncbi:MAG: GTPase Era, partial [Christensenellales bacterium]
GIRERDEGILARLKRAKAPVVAAVNKVDIASKDKVKAALERLEAESWLNAVIPISAAKGEGLADLEGKFRSFLVPGPKYFPDDMVTDQPERVLCAEMIREQALLLLKEEVPHGLGVDIEKMEIRENGLTDIWATIYCERESHKGIIIGKGGAMLKEIGQRARGEIEWMLGARVNLQLWIKVKEDWRNRASTLRMLGYQDEN